MNLDDDTLDVIKLSEESHKFGISLHNLGKVLDLVKSKKKVYSIVLTEIIARVVKNVIFEKFREIETEDETQYKTYAAE
jgi:hypothetical protein